MWIICWQISTLGELEWSEGGEGGLPLSICARSSRSWSAAVSDLTRLFKKQDKFLIRYRIFYVLEPIDAMFFEETTETIDKLQRWVSFHQKS